jgi:hypothetical protein
VLRRPAFAAPQRRQRLTPGGTVPKIEVRLPEELGLSKKQKQALQKSFESQLIETIGAEAAAAAKAKLIVVDVRAKSKNQIV